ncbi:MAG: DNA-processing protein DprA [Fusobacterium sp.]|nr:DNA-processing protein DprA [Fusobacterium sp.]
MKNNFFTIDDEIYPESLKNISNPPKKIYYLGNPELLKNERFISVVGTRNNSSYGKFCCENIVKKLVQSNVVIVSGFAIGIDTIAHKTALEKKAKTIAVVASGLDIVYPASNIHLWKQMEEEGLILSEFDFGVKPFRTNFPRRNRIIAGLSRATIVIESKEKGGSLVTADLALEEGRDVYAVPADIFSENSKGCNNLIRDCRAKLLSNADEILTDYDWLENYDIREKEEKYDSFSDLQKNILKVLTCEKNLDRIIEEIGCNSNEILSEIMELEILGLIKSLSGGKYIKL